MKRLLTLIAFSLGALVTLAADLSAQVQFSPSTYSFGKIIQHAVVNKRFYIKNTSSAPVRITEAVPDCGCTELFLKDSTITPRDSVALDVVFHTRSFLGFLRKRPSVKIAGSDQKIELEFNAEILTKTDVTKPLVLSPIKVDISQYGEKPRRKGTFSITNTSSTNLVITSVDAKFKRFDVQLPDTVKAGQTVQGVVILHKDQIESSFEDGFTFEINDAVQSRYTVPIIRNYLPKRAGAGSASGS